MFIWYKVYINFSILDSFYLGKYSLLTQKKITDGALDTFRTVCDKSKWLKSGSKLGLVPA